ncbi:MAG TPA: ferredoxin [Sphingobacteriaceae bacterium]|nr:ferredoxin [Sphingobacteriaceae bacterium]
MAYPKNYIWFTLTCEGEEHILNTYPGEYRNLRDLIADKLFLDGYGECGGMGRCATCMVEIDGLKGGAATMKRNESATLLKVGLINSTFRLACQIAIDDDLSNMNVTVVTNY